VLIYGKKAKKLAQYFCNHTFFSSFFFTIRAFICAQRVCKRTIVIIVINYYYCIDFLVSCLVMFVLCVCIFMLVLCRVYHICNEMVCFLVYVRQLIHNNNTNIEKESINANNVKI